MKIIIFFLLSSNIFLLLLICHIKDHADKSLGQIEKAKKIFKKVLNKEPISEKEILKEFFAEEKLREWRNYASLY